MTSAVDGKEVTSTVERKSRKLTSTKTHKRTTFASKRKSFSFGPQHKNVKILSGNGIRRRDGDHFGYLFVSVLFFIILIRPSDCSMRRDKTKISLDAYNKQPTEDRKCVGFFQICNFSMFENLLVFFSFCTKIPSDLEVRRMCVEVLSKSCFQTNNKVIHAKAMYKRWVGMPPPSPQCANRGERQRKSANVHSYHVRVSNCQVCVGKIRCFCFLISVCVRKWTALAFAAEVFQLFANVFFFPPFCRLFRFKITEGNGVWHLRHGNNDMPNETERWWFWRYVQFLSDFISYLVAVMSATLGTNFRFCFYHSHEFLRNSVCVSRLLLVCLWILFAM